MPNAKLVKPANKKEEKDKQGTEDMCVQNNTQQHDMMDLLSNYDGSDDVVLWEARDVTQGNWKEGQIAYSYNTPHAIIVEGIPVSKSSINRQFRGYIAIDELNLDEPNQCGGFCTFEAGTCGWEQDSVDDDFEWILSRGSLNPSTGPPRDRSSFSHGGMTGGFAMIEAGFPRRPGDRARLMTQEFQATDPNSPLCMRFWTHMYGSGIGTLRVIIFETEAKKDVVIWQISGEAGNLWYQGQVPIASPSPFKIIFEGEVGGNSLGNIALDDISIIQGACPSAPQIAGSSVGDCTFEVDECGWVNPGARDRQDEVDWVRTTASESREPRSDHTIGTPQGFFMTIPRSSIQRAGDRAWLRSPIMKGSAEVMCASFWYYMYEPFVEPTGPALGSLTLLLWMQDPTTGIATTTPLWSLSNHQGPKWLYAQATVESATDYAIVFEGAWGRAAGVAFQAVDDITIFRGDCETKPESARISMGDCGFQRGVCGWTNSTSDADFTWSLASISRRPAGLQDHTFSRPTGYVFFDVFNQNKNEQTLRLTSNMLPKKQEGCLSFWFAHFGTGAKTSLTVNTLPADGDVAQQQEIWKHQLKEGNGIQAQTRPKWTFAQVPLKITGSGTDFVVAFVGVASNGGYALDDVKFYDMTCKVRPKESDPAFVEEKILS